MTISYVENGNTEEIPLADTIDRAIESVVNGSDGGYKPPIIIPSEYRDDSDSDMHHARKGTILDKCSVLSSSAKGMNKTPKRSYSKKNG